MDSITDGLEATDDTLAMAIAELGESLYLTSSVEQISRRMPHLALIIGKRRELITAKRTDDEQNTKPVVPRSYLPLTNRDLDTAA